MLLLAVELSALRQWVHSPTLLNRLFMTRQILMHSGIGPAAELNKHSIPVIVDLSGVGTHLQDHPHVQTRYRANPESGSVAYLYRRTDEEKAMALEAEKLYATTGTGPMTCNVSN